MHVGALQHITATPPSKSLTTHQFWWSRYIIQCAMIRTAETSEINWQWSAWCTIHFSVSSGYLAASVSTKLCECCDPPLLTLWLWCDEELCFRYLTGNQLSGESSVEGYIDALKRGCRCVECAYTYFVSIRDHSIGPSCPAMYGTKQN